MVHDVFISYSSRDKAVADAACATLERRKVRCWIAPRDVLPGTPYGEALIDGIHGSRLMVLVFSASSNESPQVMREVERAVSRGIPIIPFRIENVPPSKSMEYYISAPHWLDALTPPLEQHLEKLAETVELLITGKQQAAIPVIPEPPVPSALPPVSAARPPAARLPAWVTSALAALVVVVLGMAAWYVFLRPHAAPAPAAAVGAITPAAAATLPAATVATLPAAGATAQQAALATPSQPGEPTQAIAQVAPALTETPAAQGETTTPEPIAALAPASATPEPAVTKPTPKPCSPTIAFGDSVSCTLGANKKQDTYTFEGKAGDAVIARELTKAGVVRLSGTILDAGEVAVCSFGEDFQPYDDGCKLPSDGTYTVRLERIGANQSSPVPYTLYLQRRNDPADTLTVQLDQSLSGSLDRPMEIQSYAFSAKAGDLVVPRVDTSSDGTGPRVSFWDPGGADICLFGSLSPSEHWDSGCSLPTDGTYSVQVERDADEARQTAPVAYSLYLYRRYPPDAAKPITMGQTLTGSLVALLEVDSYTFDAKSGDSVVVMTRVSSGAGHLRATVWNPRNEALCTVYSDPMSLGPVCKLSSDGPYTIEVRGYGEQKSEAGPYTISLKQGEAS